MNAIKKYFAISRKIWRGDWITPEEDEFLKRAARKTLYLTAYVTLPCSIAALMFNLSVDRRIERVWERIERVGERIERVRMSRDSIFVEAQTVPESLPDSLISSRDSPVHPYGCRTDQP